VKNSITILYSPSLIAIWAYSLAGHFQPGHFRSAFHLVVGKGRGFAIENCTWTLYLKQLSGLPNTIAYVNAPDSRGDRGYEGSGPSREWRWWACSSILIDTRALWSRFAELAVFFLDSFVRPRALHFVFACDFRGLRSAFMVRIWHCGTALMCWCWTLKLARKPCPNTYIECQILYTFPYEEGSNFK